MGDLLDLSFSFPTIVFTIPLLICLLWFLLSLVLSGLDFGDDLDIDLDGDGNIDFLEGLTHSLHVGALGLSLSLLLMSFGGWAITLVYAAVARSLDAGGLLFATIGMVIGVFAGIGFLKGIGGPLSRAIATKDAPERQSAVGCLCKVRTVDVTPTFGDAEIVTGPMRPSIVKVRAAAGEFHRGDIALLVELDADADAYWIAELAEELRPELPQ